ncbi:zinc finger protein 420-like isoform X2 [Xiphophorus maculatus]|uniref:zinc finger protein 420-like isoform X2 n=1 Tax=Xiphophorus maculatus TaxID=8083 RepID=UPI000C6D00B6|nr:zinc finger protein 420-like isoform X2 [Xiphophorus maculatus]
MDETSAAAEIGEERAENVAGNVDKDDENNEHSSAKDAADRDELFCCRNCGEAFSEEAAYLEHRLQHPPQNTHLDSQSDGLLDSEKDNEALYFCSYCALSFVEMSELHLHMKDHDQISLKGSDINPGATKQHAYECADCGKSYTVIGHFLNHQRSHRQPSKSVFHDLEHLKKKSFQCESCGRNYSRASALDAHRRCHQEKLVKSKNRNSGETVQPAESPAEVKPCENPTEEDSDKLFKCLCGKGFSSMMRLKTHQRFSRNTLCSPEEMKQKPKKGCGEFYCSECNKAFNGHIALFNHQRWHANHSDNTAKRFPCEECGKEFMTLTFYYRHQRTAHSDETPSKSFQHQVCQLQKKAFECKDCGLKFSRASALQSHRLQHTDVFRETEKAHSESTLPSQRGSESEQKVSEHLEASVEGTAKAETIPPTDVGGGQQINEMDEEMESYEPGDFNVQVISASESEDEGLQETNPDLELLCESDQDIREDAEVYPGSLVSKPDVDLKIIQIDFAQSVQCPPIENEAQLKTAEERFGCPECYRWFNNPSSLRVHRMWHTVRRRRHQNQAKENDITCEDCGLTFTVMDAYETHLHQHALDEEEAQPRDNETPTEHVQDEENKCEDRSAGVDGWDGNGSAQTQPLQLTQGNRLSVNPTRYACTVCGKSYTYLVSFQKHQKMHEKPREKEKVQNPIDPNLRLYECPDCGMSFIRRTRLVSHLRVHRSKRRNKLPKCDQCNKVFISVKTWTAHLELHKERRFWCLSCAQGFLNEGLLDKHLQNHSRRQQNHKADNRSIHDAKPPVSPPKLQRKQKPHVCPHCAKRFWRSRQLFRHTQKHLRCEGRVATEPPGSSVMYREAGDIKTETSISEGEKLEEDPSMKELQVKEEGVQDEEQSPHTAAEDGDQEDSEDSDCGEPGHHFELSEPRLSDDQPSSEAAQSPTRGEMEKAETKFHRGHKYWEWECIECDMGFDEMAKLHSHYVKHATGELPIPKEEIEV